jgi:SAM-dependent methyltransferase
MAAMLSQTPVHHAAASGFQTAADSYVRGRPDYPPELADWLRDAVGLRSGQSAVDLGAGTGKFTPYLLATGARVIAVEPVAGMRAKFSAAQPGVEVLAGTADAIPLPDASADAVVCAQSFHWFATREALADIHRVLKPGGRLALVWNMRDARVGWVAELDRIINAVEGDTPRYHSGAWRAAFPFPGFGDLRASHFALGHTGPVQDVVVQRVRSTSFIGAMPDAERARIDAQVNALIERTPELRQAGPVTVPYTTAAYVTTKER